MAHRTARPAHRLLVGAATALALVILGPAVTEAHASLVSSDPADGATLGASPLTISATFAEEFDTGRSSMELVGPDGATVATSEPAAAPTADSMTISGFGALPTGTYSVRWITITPDDNGIERGTFSFTVAAASLAPTGASSAAPGAGASAAASPGPVDGVGSGGLGDVALPLLALAALVGLGLAWFVRRSR